MTQIYAVSVNEEIQKIFDKRSTAKKHALQLILDNYADYLKDDMAELKHFLRIVVKGPRYFDQAIDYWNELVNGYRVSISVKFLETYIIRKLRFPMFLKEVIRDFKESGTRRKALRSFAQDTSLQAMKQFTQQPWANFYKSLVTVKMALWEYCNLCLTNQFLHK